MKAIKHSHHEQYLRLSNDDAALLVSSGRWVYSSKFEARQAALKPRHRWRWLVGAGLAAAALASLFWAGAAHAADKPVPFKVCLTQQQAAQVYKGKKLKYREVQGERCWYAGKTLPKYAFKVQPRATGVAVKPAPLPTQETVRASAPVGSIPIAGALSYTNEDIDSGLAGAFEALCGGPCPQLMTFEQRWKLR